MCFCVPRHRVRGEITQHCDFPWLGPPPLHPTDLLSRMSSLPPSFFILTVPWPTEAVERVASLQTVPTSLCSEHLGYHPTEHLVALRLTGQGPAFWKTDSHFSHHSICLHVPVVCLRKPLIVAIEPTGNRGCSRLDWLRQQLFQCHGAVLLRKQHPQPSGVLCSPTPP